MQILNHGITAAALFYFVGLLEQRCGRRGLNDFGGLMQRTPLLCAWMSVAMFSSFGLPGLNGFIGEFLIFKGSFALVAGYSAVAVLDCLSPPSFLCARCRRSSADRSSESCGEYARSQPGENDGPSFR